MRLTVLGQPIYIISSYKIATDLLEKRSLIYSDRPIMRFAQELSVVVLKKVSAFFDSLLLAVLAGSERWF